MRKLLCAREVSSYEKLIFSSKQNRFIPSDAMPVAAVVSASSPKLRLQGEGRASENKADGKHERWRL